MPTAITHDPVFTTPVSSTNTAVVRWSGTAGSVLQNSGVLIDGSNNITGIGTIASGAITSSGAIIGTQVDILAAGDLRLQDSTGGQYVALEAAGTTTTHTLTFPAAQGSASTFLQNNGSGALTWAAAGGGKIGQVVMDTKLDTFSSGSTSFVDITGLSVSITPTATSSKILVHFSLVGSQDVGHERAYFRLMRDSTPIHVGTQDGNRTPQTGEFAAHATSILGGPHAGVYLDSPSTTSAVVYKLQARSGASYSVYINRNDDYQNDSWTGNYASNIVVMEVLA